MAVVVEKEGGSLGFTAAEARRSVEKETQGHRVVKLGELSSSRGCSRHLYGCLCCSLSVRGTEVSFFIF